MLISMVSFQVPKFIVFFNLSVFPGMGPTPNTERAVSMVFGHNGIWFMNLENRPVWKEFIVEESVH